MSAISKIQGEEYPPIYGKIRVRWEYFYMVHFNIRTDEWITFDVYKIIEKRELTKKKKYLIQSIKYCNINDPQTLVDKFEEGKCFKLLKGSICWRGHWDGRLWFPDGNEYFENEFNDLAKMYKNQITTWCRNRIKERNKEINYDLENTSGASKLK